MNVLIIINHKPNQDEMAYNAIRLALQFQKGDKANRIFTYLIADGVYCALVDNSELSIQTKVENAIENGAVINPDSAAAGRPPNKYNSRTYEIKPK